MAFKWHIHGYNKTNNTIICFGTSLYLDREQAHLTARGAEKSLQGAIWLHGYEQTYDCTAPRAGAIGGHVMFRGHMRPREECPD
jgi:hypothetical protein